MTLTNVLLLWLLLSLICTLMGTILTIRRTGGIARLVCCRCGAAREPGTCCCDACGQRLRGTVHARRLLLAQEGDR